MLRAKNASLFCAAVKDIQADDFKLSVLGVVNSKWDMDATRSEGPHAAPAAHRPLGALADRSAFSVFNRTAAKAFANSG